MMMKPAVPLQRTKETAEKRENMVSKLRNQISVLKKEREATSVEMREEQRLKRENEKLKNEIETVKRQLSMAEIKNGKRQVFVPLKRNPSKPPLSPVSALMTDPPPGDIDQTTGMSKLSKQKMEQAKPKNIKDDDTVTKHRIKSTTTREANIDVSRLDLRIGKILFSRKHLDSNIISFEDVDVGEGRVRTVVTGLLDHVPLEEMQDRMAVFLCNIKPAKIRGILSEGIVLCARSSEKTEILVPPPGAEPGDRVLCEGFTGKPDPVLNQKKKVWETLKLDMQTNENKIAVYKGIPFRTEGKGVVKAPTLSNSQIC